MSEQDAIAGVLEKFRALAGEWRQTAADLDQRAERAADEGDPTRSAILSYRAQAHTEHADRLKRVISAAEGEETRRRLRETGGGDA